jgi:hypothetical protein
MRSLQIFVETVSFGNELSQRSQKGKYSLFPLSETGFFEFDLFGESLPESFFFLFEFGIIQFPSFRFAEFTSLHLLSTVGYISWFLWVGGPS